MIINVQEANINTINVEVKSLTINGKQVTLAVFRQLQEELLVSSELTLLGTPWGKVNYHPDKCSDTKEHIHIVWQKGSELRRSSLSQRIEGQHYRAENSIEHNLRNNFDNYLYALCLEDSLRINIHKSEVFKEPFLKKYKHEYLPKYVREFSETNSELVNRENELAKMQKELLDVITKNGKDFLEQENLNYISKKESFEKEQRRLFQSDWRNIKHFSDYEYFKEHQDLEKYINLSRDTKNKEEYIKNIRNKKEEIKNKIKADMGREYTSTDLTAIIKDLERELILYRDKYNEIYKNMQDLPQLFIAV